MNPGEIISLIGVVSHLSESKDWPGEKSVDDRGERDGFGSVERTWRNNWGQTCGQT